MFRKLGYQSDMNELMADEAEWFTAVDNALHRAQKALDKMAAMKGKK